jgi:hypothetical protein
MNACSLRFEKQNLGCWREFECFIFYLLSAARCFACFRLVLIGFGSLFDDRDFREAFLLSVVS